MRKAFMAGLVTKGRLTMQQRVLVEPFRERQKKAERNGHSNAARSLTMPDDSPSGFTVNSYI
jgi:hypothetical protein